MDRHGQIWTTIDKIWLEVLEPGKGKIRLVWLVKLYYTVMRPLSNLIELLYGKNNGKFKVCTNIDKNRQNSLGPREGQK